MRQRMKLDERAHQIIELTLSEEAWHEPGDQPLTVRWLAEKLGIHQTTSYRILRALTERGSMVRQWRQALRRDEYFITGDLLSEANRRFEFRAHHMLDRAIKAIERMQAK